MSDPETVAEDDARTLAERARLLALIAPGVSHELTNRLSGIAAYAEVARRDERLPEDLRADVELMRAEVEAAQRVSRGFLELARGPRGVRSVDVVEMVRQTLDLLAYWTGPGRVEVTLDVQPHLPPVVADPVDLKLALLAMTTPHVCGVPRGTLTVSVESAPEAAGAARVHVRVTATGASQTLLVVPREA